MAFPDDFDEVEDTPTNRPHLHAQLGALASIIGPKGPVVEPIQEIMAARGTPIDAEVITSMDDDTWRAFLGDLAAEADGTPKPKHVDWVESIGDGHDGDNLAHSAAYAASTYLTHRVLEKFAEVLSVLNSIVEDPHLALHPHHAIEIARSIAQNGVLIGQCVASQINPASPDVDIDVAVMRSCPTLAEHNTADQGFIVTDEFDPGDAFRAYVDEAIARTAVADQEYREAVKGYIQDGMTPEEAIAKASGAEGGICPSCRTSHGEGYQHPDDVVTA